MTDIEKTIAINLNKCRYLPASFEKRFARDMSFIAENNPTIELTEKQREQLYRQLKIYRKQLPQLYRLHHPEARSNNSSQATLF